MFTKTSENVLTSIKVLSQIENELLHEFLIIHMCLPTPKSKYPLLLIFLPLTVIVGIISAILVFQSIVVYVKGGFCRDARNSFGNISETANSSKMKIFEKSQGLMDSSIDQ